VSFGLLALFALVTLFVTGRLPKQQPAAQPTDAAAGPPPGDDDDVVVGLPE
jgi:hypothetical protein